MAGYYDVPPGRPFEPTALVRDCVEKGSDALLCDEAVLPAAFFDLSTGLAGELLHRLSIYRLRLAAVVPVPAAHSANFQAFVAEANQGGLFRFFPTRQDAVRWLESDP